MASIKTRTQARVYLSTLHTKNELLPLIGYLNGEAWKGEICNRKETLDSIGTLANFDGFSYALSLIRDEEI